MTDPIPSYLELVDPGFDLDPGAIRVVAEWFEEQLQESRDPVADLCRFVNGLSNPSQILNGEKVLREILQDSPTLAKPLQRACKPHGRIDAPRRPVIASALSSTPPSKPTSPAVTVVSRNEVGLALNPDNTAFLNLPRLIAELAKLDRERFPSLGLRIAVEDFVYASGLAVVATWCVAHRTLPSIDFPSDAARRYCERIGFIEALGGAATPLEERGEKWSLRLTPIRRETKPERTAEEILQILDIFVAPKPDERNGLAVFIGELVENVHRHAEPHFPGFVVAQVYPEKLKLGLTIADSGIGIPESFRRSALPEFRGRVDDDAQCLQLAIQPLVTSKPEHHSGYGLYLLSELIARNGGSFMICSGKAALTGYGRRKKLQTSTQNIAPWHGTVVSSIIDLRNPLPLAEVYRTLPIPEGFDEDDFPFE